MRKLKLLVFSLLVCIVIINGCAWVAHDREYFIRIENYDEKFIADLIALVESYFESRGFKLEEKHVQTLPDIWWFIEFQPTQIKTDFAQNCRDLSICIRPLSQQRFSIIYRIECIEDFFGNPNINNPTDIWTITKDDNLSMLLETTGKKFDISFIEERYATFGKCRLW